MSEACAAKTTNSARRMLGPLLLAAGMLMATSTARSEDIVAAQYGNSTGSMPYAVALAKGFFKESGADVSGVIGSNGGGADVRNLLAGQLAYAESALPSVITAIQKGADLVIVSDNVQNAASIVLVTMPNSPIQTVRDLKGKRMGFSSPQSFTQAIEYWLLDANGYSQKDVTLVSTSGFGPGLTALENNGVDLTVSPLPNFLMAPGKYRAVMWGRDVFPPICNTVGVVSRRVAKERPQMVKSIIAGRRKAVEFMTANRAESAAIIGKVYRLDPAVMIEVMQRLIDDGKVDGIPYWGLGKFNYPGMEHMIRAARLNGMIQGEFELSKIVDESFLPEDLRNKP
jgi:NitT/TauT family transport system substrate-binding protein